VWIHARACPEFDALRRDHDNLRAAVAWGLGAGEAERVLALVSALSEYMWYAPARTELLRWWQPAFAAAGEQVTPRDRARALLASARSTEDLKLRLEHIREAVAIARPAGDPATTVRGLESMANLLELTGDRTGARAAADEALALARGVGDDALIGAALSAKAWAAPDLGAAAAIAREAAAHLHAVGAGSRVAQLFSYLGFVALVDEDYDRAEALGLEALKVAHAIADPYTSAFVQGNMALSALLGGRSDAARSGFGAELDIGHRHGFELFYFEALLGLAALAAEDGDDRRAGVLEGAAWALSDRPLVAGEPAVYGRVRSRFIQPAQARLGDGAWASAQAAGREMTADAAVTFALEPFAAASAPG
jgi:hypothetical protein